MDFPSSVIYDEDNAKNDVLLRLEALRLAAFAFDGKADRSQILIRAKVYLHYLKTGDILPEGLPNNGNPPVNINNI